MTNTNKCFPITMEPIKQVGIQFAKDRVEFFNREGLKCKANNPILGEYLLRMFHHNTHLTPRSYLEGAFLTYGTLRRQADLNNTTLPYISKETLSTFSQDIIEIIERYRFGVNEAMDYRFQSIENQEQLLAAFLRGGTLLTESPVSFMHGACDVYEAINNTYENLELANRLKQ